MKTHGVVEGPDGLLRCPVPTDDPEYLRYHDEEWGVPVHDEVRLYEKLCLEGFQAGLSWQTILHKRPAFRAVFADFDPHRVAGFDDEDVAWLLADDRIVRNRQKIEATIANARALIDLHGSGGTLDGLIWQHAPPEPGDAPVTMADVPASTPESTALARQLKRAGFRFVGPTTAYAAMQSLGVVDDHLAECFRRGAVSRPGTL